MKMMNLLPKINSIFYKEGQVMEVDDEDEDMELLKGKFRWEELKKGL